MDNYQQQGGGYQQQPYNQQGGYQQPYNQQGGYQQPYNQPGSPYNGQPDYSNQQPYNQFPVNPKPAMGFGEAVATCFSKYCCFSGRATRAEYWWFYLFGILCSMLSWILDLVVGISLFSYLVSLGLLLPNLGVAWRRFHDIGKGGGWYFIGLIPLVGWIIYLVWMCKASEPFDNRFGPYEG